MSEAYRPFDQQEKLGEPPWKGDDPALIAWERAHGHDVRLKCYPEFGCLAIEAEADELRRERDEARQRAERAEAALRVLRLSAHVGVKEAIGRGENASAVRFRAIRQHAQAALAADQPAEAGGEE